VDRGRRRVPLEVAQQPFAGMVLKGKVVRTWWEGAPFTGRPDHGRNLETARSWMKKALLALTDGTTYPAGLRGRGETRGSRLQHHMTGYQEVLSDPSYKGRCGHDLPEIGNYG